MDRRKKNIDTNIVRQRDTALRKRNTHMYTHVHTHTCTHTHTHAHTHTQRGAERQDWVVHLPHLPVLPVCQEVQRHLSLPETRNTTSKLSTLKIQTATV